jgi:hypothetical protein
MNLSAATALNRLLHQSADHSNPANNDGQPATSLIAACKSSAEAALGVLSEPVNWGAADKEGEQAFIIYGADAIFAKSRTRSKLAKRLATQSCT